MKTTGFIDEQSHGVFVISTTPFSKDGSIDLDSADSLVEFYIEKNVSGITILGMMGEANKLSANESEIFIKHVIERVNNRVPVLVGVSDAGLKNLVRLSQYIDGFRNLFKQSGSLHKQECISVSQIFVGPVFQLQYITVSVTLLICF